jgi:expansin (peptidoglycan-binding protein)
LGRRARRQQKLAAPSSDYVDPDGNVLSLRGSLTAGTRTQYAQALAGGTRAADTQEDAWQRAGEMLFERLAVRWVIAGAPITSQRELLVRFRVASREQREWVRGALREHCAEHFPDVAVP